MTIKRILAAGLLTCALLMTECAHSQSYFYGYYYPDSNTFRTDRIPKTGYEYYGVPMFLEGRVSAANRQVQPAMAAGSVPVLPANISVKLPSADARVWFENHLTTFTGTHRSYVTPPLTAGTSFHYHLTVRWMEGGREVAAERDVTVFAGQTAVVDFTR